MFNSLIKNFNSSLESLPKISSIQNTLFQQANNQPQLDIQVVVDQILNNLSIILSEKLGQKIQMNQFKQLSSQILKSKSLQNHLINTKQKYNQLVNKSTNLQQNIRKISNSIGQFITSINLFFQSQELLIPLKEIQKGINQIQPEKVQKQINYLIKIFQQNFNQLITHKIKISQQNLSQEIKLLRNLNKNLQGQIISLKSNKNSQQSKYFQLISKITSLNEKISKINNQKTELQRQLKIQQGKIYEKERNGQELGKDYNNLKIKQKQYLQKIKILQIKLNRSEKNMKERNEQIKMLQNVIQKLKNKQQEIVEEMEIQCKKKEIIFQTARKKIYNQKSHLQQKISKMNDKFTNLQVQIAIKNDQYKKLSQQLNNLKQKGFVQVDLDSVPQNQKHEQQKQPQDSSIQTIQKKQPQKISLNQLMSKLNSLQICNKELNERLIKMAETNINKQVFKNLFINYDDESKQWSVRRNIKNQIYVLLNVIQKIQKAEEPKNLKWFGLF